MNNFLQIMPLLLVYQMEMYNDTNLTHERKYRDYECAVF